MVTVVRHHSDFGAGQRRIAFDAVDEGRAPWTGSKRSIERDDRGPSFGDDFERAKGVGVDKREQFVAVSGGAFFERRHQRLRRNQHGARLGHDR